jgi:beta-galactosidase
MKYLNCTGYSLFLLILLSLKGFAQDTIPLKGNWKIQPAQSPMIWPDISNWGETNGTDQASNWRWDLLSGKGTSWEKMAHDSVNSLWYEKKINIPQNWQKRRVIADFRRLEGDAIIFINHKSVSELLRPGGEVDLTNAIEPGKENILNIFVTRNYTGISRGFEQDALRYQTRKAGSNQASVWQWGMGITAQVNIISRADQAITDVFCIPSFRKKSLTLEVEVDAKQVITGTTLEADIVDETGKVVLKLQSENLKLTAGKAVYRISAPWDNPICWELEKSYLYKARVSLKQQGSVISKANDQTFGFREIWTEGRQLYMNGHLSRWRITDLYGTNKNGLSFQRMIGYNVGQIQPASNLWWADQSETPKPDEDLLNEMDRIGMGLTLPAPSVVVLRQSLLANKQMQQDYQREAEYYIRHYRNHPCILAWVVSMNSANPKLNIWAQGMGKRDTASYTTQQKVINLACTYVKQIDPTRLAFSHADGSVGDVSTANVYLNFVPLQEREEWPMEWVKNGNMPYSAVEFGTPYWNNFWKGNQLLLTEYLSMYLGDDAYIRESEAGLKNTIPISISTDKDKWGKMNMNQFPAFWDFQKMFSRNTDRSWRTWGVNAGVLPWVLEGYGDPQDGKPHRFTDRYKLAAPLTEIPKWVSPRFWIWRENNTSLLTYIAGAPVHTDKTHTFYSGEKFQKQIAAVWDGSVATNLNAEWQLKKGEQIIQQGRQTLQLKAGEIKLQPFQLTAPTVQQRTDYQLILSVKQDNSTVAKKDTFALAVFPKPSKLSAQLTIAVYDPAGKSTPWIKSLGAQTVTWKKGSSVKILIIGREALKPGDTMPYTEQDIADGLHVIVLEQKPEVWSGMGFQTTETMPRHVFIRDKHSPLLNGIEPQDLINWRGTPDLLPEGKPAKEYDTQHAPKWTNTHAVASVVIKTPETAGFTPILQTEFDMAYSPLLEWRYGKGKITYCTLDLTGRVGNEPAATRMAQNLLQSQQAPLPSESKVYYAGAEEGAALLSKLGIAFKRDMPAGNALWVIGEGSKLSVSATSKFAAQGGTILYLPQSGSDLSMAGFKTVRKDIYQVKGDDSDLLRGIGPGLLRWRDALNVSLFSTNSQPAGCKVLAGGLVLERKIGKGRAAYLQAVPDMLDSKYTDAPEKAEAIQLSVVRLNQLMAQLLTNLGANANPDMAARLNRVIPPPAYQTLGAWKVMGPYLVNTTDVLKVLETKYPGEQDAIDGAENPNITYKRSDGVMLDWRKVVNADESGFVNLGKAFNGVDDNAVAYVTKTISSEFNQNATLRLGVDYWMQVWVNGKQVFQLEKSHQKRANEYVLNIPLKKGENIITMKVISGRGGFGFWANLNYHQEQSAINSSAKISEVSFYTPLFKYFDPYQFNYW